MLEIRDKLAAVLILK